MDKSKFEKFINKYNLGGACESVLYTVDDTTLTTRAISDDKNVLCEVSAPAMGIESGNYAVYETARLRSLLGVLGENLTVKTKRTQDKLLGIMFNDNLTEVTFVLADTSVIPTVPDLKKLPPFDAEIDMDEQFINTFVRAKGALSEVDTFAVMSDGSDDTAEIVLGYSVLNTNRIRIKAKMTSPVEVKPISFSAKYLREILVANKDAKNGKLEISSKGLIRTSFSVDNITSTYYLVQIDTKD